jgi:hypothetical protein
MTKHLQKRFTLWAVIVGGILMIPLIAQFPWSTGDFIFAGVILFGVAALYEIISSRLNSWMYRLIAAVSAIGTIMLIWAWAVN